MSADAPTFLSVFSGVGGFDLGLERSGWRCAGQIEVDPFCGRVLARHWPDVPRWGDVRSVSGDSLSRPGRHAQFECGSGRVSNAEDRERQRRVSGGSAAVDLLCGGFPCQDLSVAGRRAGLSAARSGHFFEFVRLAGELRPRWILLENVPGLFSSNGGRDFALILHTLDQLGYGVSWRVLDSRYFGVPQRRRRVFLVGHLGAACPFEVLFESEGGARDIAAGSEAGESASARSRTGTYDSGDGADNLVAALSYQETGRGWWNESDTTMVTAHEAKNGGTAVLPIAFSNRALDTGSATERLRSRSHGALPMVAATLGASNTRHTSGLKSEADLLTVSPPLRTEGHDASEDGASAVRRLTATECELLQSFPPGWTCICGVQPYSTASCRCPDSPRYAALGNAVTVNVITWLGQRLLAAHTERMP